jgi:sporulation protein YpjB
MKKVVAVIIIWVVFSLLPLRMYAAGTNELNQLLDESLQLVKQEEYEKAKQILLYASKEYPVRVSSPQHMSVISMAYDKAVQSIDEGTSQKEKEDDMLALRLVIDAESSKFQPLWLNREHAVMGAFGKMEEAMKKEDSTQFQQALNEFLHEFYIIYPSLSVDLSQEELQRLNAHLSYLDESRGAIAKHTNGKQQMKVIRQDVEGVFQYPAKDEAAPSLIWVIITTGGIIVFTLTYVGWRKYKGEQEKRKSRVKNG